VQHIQITVLVATAAASVVAAESRDIGTASCSGTFWVDIAGVSDHATLFENRVIETEAPPLRCGLAVM
jgi:hypothetical protein